MNIFILDSDIKVNARYHVDKHVVKMITELAQLLSTANRMNWLDEGYKITHINHPCSIWVRKSLDNWLYTMNLLEALQDEYAYRYGNKIHKAYEVAMELSIPNLPKIGLTPFAQVVPDLYKNRDVVIAYRNFYIQEKKHIASWKNREVPDWFKPVSIKENNPR